MTTYTDRQKACIRALQDACDGEIDITPSDEAAAKILAYLESKSPIAGFSEPTQGALAGYFLNCAADGAKPHYLPVDDEHKDSADVVALYFAEPSHPAAPSATAQGASVAVFQEVERAAAQGATLTDERIREIENEQARISGASRDNLTVRTVRACFASIKPEPRTSGETVFRFGDDGVCRIAQAHMLTDLANAVCLEMSELPDRNSPEDDPEAMIANDDEMHGCIASALEKTGLCLAAAKPVSVDAQAAAADVPIPMLLLCPTCGAQHIDAPDERSEGWNNPPHRSHLCHACGIVWRPADVPTIGVASITTKGKADSWDVDQHDIGAPTMTDELILRFAEQAWTVNRDDEQKFYLDFARSMLAVKFQSAPNVAADTAADSGLTERAAFTSQQIYDKFDFLEGLVNEQTYCKIADTAIEIYTSVAANRGAVGVQTTMAEPCDVCGLLDANKCAKCNSKRAADTAADETDYEALEREHLGDPDKRTGIYAPKESGEWAPNTCAGFRGGFHALHRRAPTEQEVWDAGVKSGISRASVSDDKRLDKPAQVGNTRFSANVKWSTVIGAAQRHHEYMNTPDKEAERIAGGNEFLEKFQRASMTERGAVTEAGIAACAFMIKGICMTHPQDVWTAKIKERILHMLGTPRADGS